MGRADKMINWKNEGNIKIDWQVITLFLVCISFSFLFYSAGIGADNMNYAIEEIHQYNNNLFFNNIGLMEAGHSPRYFANVIVSTLMSVFQKGWAGIGTLIIRLNFVLYGLAAANAAYRVSKRNHLLYGLLLVSCINRSTLGDMAFSLWGAPDVFLGTGIPLALLGITFVIGKRKNWMASWICLALAGLMHVHEGMWGGCVVGFIWLSQAIYKRKTDRKSLMGLPIYVITMLFVTVPSLLHGEMVDNDAFINIYAFIRTPHHLLPVYWGIKKIIICFFIICIPVLLMVFTKIRKKNRNLFKEELYINVSMIILWLCILGIAAYGTHINPNVTIITMYVTKCFKYVTFVTMLSLLRLTDVYIEGHAYIGAILLLGILMSGHLYLKVTIVLLIIFFILTISKFENKIWISSQPFFPEIMKVVIWMAVIAGMALIYDGKMEAAILAMYGLLFAAVFALPYSKFYRVFNKILCGAACILLIFSINGNVIRISSNGIHYISGEECLINTMGIDLYQLSLDFQAQTKNEDEFLADPYNEMAGWVQLASQRSCYAIYKNTPSSKKAVIQWYDRITEAAPMKEMDGKQLSALLRKINLEYVLVYPEQYELVDESNDLEVFIKNNGAAIYKLR